MTIQALGGQGGLGFDGSGGGKGGSVTATISVTPGETLAIFVGGQGGDATNNQAGAGGFNGGAAG